MTTKSDDLSLEDLNAMLLNQEICINNAQISFSPKPQANIANSSSRFNGRGKGHGRGRGQGRARFTRSLNQPVANQSGACSSVICQLCNRSNHQTAQCWYLFDHSYNTNNSTTPSALAATTAEHLYDPNWYPHSGATNHVTADLQNLNSHCEYQGPDTIKVGDGTGLRILHTGSSSIQTPHKSLLLNKILHVPSITQNLLSVSQFTRDKNVYFEFHPSFFVVKDIQSGKELLHRPNKGGLYCLKHTNSHSTPSIFISSSFDTWHRRLGHPMMRTIHQVVSRNSLPLKNKRVFLFFFSLSKES